MKPRQKPTSAQLDKLMHVGGMMANVCWNFGVNRSLAMTDNDRDILRELQRQWDAAMREIATAAKKAGATA